MRIKAASKMQGIMKTTMKGFKGCLSTAMAALVEPVKRQLRADNVEEFFEDLENVTRSHCGAAAGFTGFIYYTETSDFWIKYRKKIMKLAEEEAEEFGDGSVMDMVKKFKVLENDWTDDEIGRALWGRFDQDLMYIYNAMAWYVLELMAYRYDEYKYEVEHNL